MPELPEVETVRQTLKQQILGEVIDSVTVLYAPIIENINKDEFCEKLKNEQINRIERYGKYLIFILTNYSIISHLRMEGKFFLKSKTEEIVKHEHIIFTFKSGLTLRYHDTRKFGKMALVHSTNMDIIMSYPSLKKLGPEANTDKLTKEYLFNALIKRKEAIKTALLNQEIIAGLGNIYVDEVCFKCHLNPSMSCSKITMDDAQNIINASREILDKAILAGGTTIRSYTSSLGVTGRFQVSLNVHTKVGCSCPSCGNTIIKTVVGGRGTYLCPSCQDARLPKVIGITGGIASGKTTIKDYLVKCGFSVIDSDEIVKKLYQNEKVINQIGQLFGPSYIDNCRVNTNELGKLIFNNSEERSKLNNLIHPQVKAEIKKKIAETLESLIFIDVPLLYESSMNSLCDKVIVVNVDLETNIKRLMKRENIDYEYALTKINSQMPLSEKCQKADFIIDNSKDLCYTYKQVTKILNEIK